MKLVIGGAFQGKRAYACQAFHIEETDIADGADCERNAIFRIKMLVHFQEYVRRFIEEADFLKVLPEELIKRNPGVVLVTNELGYGVVPMDAFDRNYRETHGRLCCALAKEAEQVHRVVCGIGTVIKDTGV